MRREAVLAVGEAEVWPPALCTLDPAAWYNKPLAGCHESRTGEKAAHALSRAHIGRSALAKSGLCLRFECIA